MSRQEREYLGEVPIDGDFPLSLDLKHEVIIYWSDDDQAFIAEVPELPGCAAGQTAEEALANVKVVASEWIDTARELGRDVPIPRGRLIA